VTAHRYHPSHQASASGERHRIFARHGAARRDAELLTCAAGLSPGLASPGQHGDSPYVTALMDAIRIRRRGQGRPRRRPGRAMADKACSCAANRAWLRDHRITAVIPVRDDQKKDRRNRGRAGGRPPAFDAGWYREHNTAGRCCRRRARRGSLGARLLTPADDIESAEGLQLYADPAGHPFCLRWG